MIIDPNSKLLMIGDSITDCGRARPVGDMWPKGALGDGYVGFVAALLDARYPTHNFRVFNMGLNGNTVMDLQARWQTDVLDLKPDWFSICIGTSDVWSQFPRPQMAEKHVSLELYSQTLDALLTKTKPLCKGVILMTPYYIEPNRSEPVRAMMDIYGTAVRQIAEKHQAIFVDTQAVFDTLLTQTHSSAFAWDRVHSNQAGHMALARAFLQSVEYKWE